VVDPMTSIELGPNGLLLDGHVVPLVSAEFHYFRHNALWWPRCLEAIKAAEIDIVSTFVCWDFHEIAPGTFDFAGVTNPSRDLIGFLNQCAEAGFKVLIRPGPVIDAGWETRGPARDVMTLERLDPVFLDRASQYISAVSEVLRPAQYTQGGPVIMLSIDDEILYPYNTSGGEFESSGNVDLPYRADSYDAAFRRWLAGTYHELSAVNDALRTSFTDWKQAKSPKFATDPPSYSLAGFRFANEQIVNFAQVCKDMFTAGGIDVPMYTNLKQLLSYVDAVAVADVIGAAAINVSMPTDMPGDLSLVANWWLRLHTARFPFAWAAEMQAGWTPLAERYGYITAQHSEYMPMAAQAAGIRGANFFMFVECDDWAYSPVNITGKVRPDRHGAFKRVAASYKAIEPGDSHQSDVGLLWNLEQHQLQFLSSDSDWSTLAEHSHAFPPVDAREDESWWATFRAMTSADIDFDIWIPGVSAGTAPKILVNCGSPTGPKGYLEAIVTMAEAGAHIIEVSALPTHDVAGRPHQRTRDQVSELRRTGMITCARPEEVPDALAALGARRYARAEQGGVWTFVYRAASGAVTLGVWNPGERPYSGMVHMDPSVFAHSLRWTVSEPRLAFTRRAVPVPSEFHVQIDPRSAKVFSFTAD
jgi:Glycosyl hydrolases family 35